MIRSSLLLVGAVATLLLPVAPLAADEVPFTKTADFVNRRMVKLFGSGGFKGLVPYGTGILVSPDGYVLTVANHLLDTADLRVHLYDGRRYDKVKVMVTEPVLDLALVKIDIGDEQLPFFDVPKAAQAPIGQTGDWIFAYSNQFEIATRDEPLSVQRGVIEAYSKLHGRRGIFEAAYTGDVYIVDTIMCNPGAAGGALTTRKGELLGIIGKELRNTLTETWINYAVPVHAKIEVTLPDGKKVTVSVAEFVEKGVRNEYKPAPVEKAKKGLQGVHGIVLVPDVIERTPAFVEEVRPDSPAAKAGLKPDDLIVYADGEQVTSVKLFNEIMSKAPPGTRVSLEVRRGDKLQTIELTLAEPPKPVKPEPKPEQPK
jgi:S1-C subfamily serine protease